MIEPEKLDVLWCNHGDRLLLIARSMSESGFAGEAEDAVQEAFLRLAIQIKMPDEPVAWLVRVIRNQLIAWHRSHTRRRRREVETIQTSWFNQRTTSVSEQIDAAEVTNALRLLSSHERDVIVMKIWGGMTFASIAEALEISRATAHRQFQSGMLVLKQKFNPEQLSLRSHASQRGSKL